MTSSSSSTIQVSVCWTVFALAMITQLYQADAYEVFNVGNQILTSASGPDLSQTSSGAAILLDQPFPTDGVVFAFQAYFRNTNPIRFQFWRQQDGVGLFGLIGEVLNTPVNTGGGVEVIYIVNTAPQNCVRVRKGDRLGVFISNESSPLVYTFNPNKLYTLIYYMNSSTSTSLSVNQTISFANAVFPYDFSLMAYYYEDGISTTNSSVDCPKDQGIAGDGNPSISTLPPPTGLPGSPGPIGPQGSNGPVGPLGRPGVPGPAGFTGPVGVVGSIGRLGLTGSTGSTGSVGYVGSTGVLGSTGGTGATGALGQIGIVGMPGPPGVVIFSNDTDTAGEAAGEVAPLSAANPLSTSDGTYDLIGWLTELRMIGALIWLSALSLIVIIFLIVLIQLTCTYAARRDGVKYLNTKSASRATTLENRHNMNIHRTTGGDVGTMKTTVGSEIGLEDTAPSWLKEEFDKEGVEETTAVDGGRGSRMRFEEEEEDSTSVGTHDLPSDFTADMTASNEMFFHNDTTFKKNSLRSKDMSFMESTIRKSNYTSDEY